MKYYITMPSSCRVDLRAIHSGARRLFTATFSRLISLLKPRQGDAEPLDFKDSDWASYTSAQTLTSTQQTLQCIRETHVPPYFYLRRAMRNRAHETALPQFGTVQWRSQGKILATPLVLYIQIVYADQNSGCGFSAEIKWLRRER